MLARESVIAGKRHGLSFYPDFISTSITDVDFNYLKKLGIKACLIDLDGTVVSRGEFKVDKKISRALKESGVPVHIATNRKKSRSLKTLKEDLHAVSVIHPKGIFGKPFKRYYEDSCEGLGLQPEQIVMIGDRFIQDIFGANRAGLYTLRVHKLGADKGKLDEYLSKIEQKFTLAIAPHYVELNVK